MKNTAYFLSTLLLVFLLTTPAAAAPRDCDADLSKFCSDVNPGGGRIVVCLEQYEKKLSRKCKRALEEVRDSRLDFAVECAEDYKRFCKNVRPGKGRMATCLKQYERRLAPKCKRALNTEGWKP